MLKERPLNGNNDRCNLYWSCGFSYELCAVISGLCRVFGADPLYWDGDCNDSCDDYWLNAVWINKHLCLYVYYLSGITSIGWQFTGAALYSEAVNLHPVAVIASVLIFGGIWGFWGLFFAIPLAALAKAALTMWTRHSDYKAGKQA